MISVVMPVYNHVQFVQEAIDSILKQTFRDFELLLVDDGSTDGSDCILKEYIRKDSRVRYFRKNNGGTGSALNLGFAHASRKYGTWVSSDNVYYPKMFQTLVDFLMGHPKCRFVFSAFSLNNESKYVLPKLKMNLKEGILKNFLCRSAIDCVTGICYLFEMSLKHECGDYLLNPQEDYVMGIKMGLKTKVGYIPTLLGMWRNHPDAVTHQLRRKELSYIKNPGEETSNWIARRMAKRGSK